MKDIKFLSFNLEGEEGLVFNKGYKYLAVLGSRNIVEYTKKYLVDTFDELSTYSNLVIVSGGMYGVDLFSLNLALKNNIPIIIILPCGITNYKNSPLFSGLNLKENSKYLFMSRYSSGFSIKKYTLLERNRDIVDLSDVVLIAQSSSKSGSIYSGNYSLKSSKLTFAFPFSLESIQFQGNNILISKGAQIFLSAKDLASSLGFSSLKNLDLKSIFNKFPLSKEEIYSILNEVDVSLIEKSLLESILKGEIFYSDGRYFKND